MKVIVYNAKTGKVEAIDKKKIRDLIRLYEKKA